MKLLDDIGLSYLWSKIKATFYTKAEVDSMISAFLATVTTNLTGITSDAPSRVMIGRSLVVHLTTSATIDTVEVMLGATDITSTAYNNGVVTIAEVTDNVIITASVAAYSITTNLTDVTSDAPASIYGGTSLTINLSTASGYGIKASTVVVTMGGDDITALAYSNGVITIPSVSGNIVVTAEAELLYIIFEDANVKTICVNNWGGGTYTGEITPAEAAVVTTLDGKFKSNTSITKFNELRYFTALTTLQAQFSGCSRLSEITIPAAPITNLQEAFKLVGQSGDGITHLDFSSITSSTLNSIASLADRSYIKEITFSNVTIKSYMNNSFDANNLTARLEKLNLNNVVFSSNYAWTNTFRNQTKLTTITGSISGINLNISFAQSPLTLSSILVIFNGLSNASRTITLKDTSGTYTNPVKGNTQYESIATDKGWTIAYS